MNGPLSTAQRPRRKPWKLALLIGGALIFTIVAVIQLLNTLDRSTPGNGPFSVADEFVSRLKHGEEVFPQQGRAERIGFAAAHELLSGEAVKQWPFEDFCQRFLLQQNEHGLITRSHSLSRGVMDGGRRAQVRYRLIYERGEVPQAQPHALLLNLGLRRGNDGWHITDCTLSDDEETGR